MTDEVNEMSAGSRGYLAALLSAAMAFAGCDVASKPEPPKPIITVCSGCGTEWESMGPGQPKPITTCPNCPMTPEEFERLKEEMRRRKDEAR
jgi:hypothetical protein